MSISGLDLNVSVPNACANILDGSSAIQLPTEFDGGNGTLYIIDASDCWANVKANMESVIAAGETAKAQIINSGVATEAEVDAAINVVRNAVDYGSGYVLYSRWQWDETALVDGDRVGMCVYQKNEDASIENSASCWGIRINTDRTYALARSFLIKPSDIAADTKLGSLPMIATETPTGVKGQWIVAAPSDVDGNVKSMIAGRFLPKSTTPEDVAIGLGSVEIATYYSNAAARPARPANGGLFASEHMRLMQDDESSFSGNDRFESEQKELSCYDDATCESAKTGAMQLASTVFAAAVGAAAILF